MYVSKNKFWWKNLLYSNKKNECTKTAIYATFHSTNPPSFSTQSKLHYTPDNLALKKRSNIYKKPIKPPWKRAPFGVRRVTWRDACNGFITWEWAGAGTNIIGVFVAFYVDFFCIIYLFCFGVVVFFSSRLSPRRILNGQMPVFIRIMCIFRDKRGRSPIY